MVSAEMIPMGVTSLSFWQKFYELQYKMFFNHQENVQNHMYSSEPLEWPLTGRGIAYWVSSQHNVSNKKLYISYGMWKMVDSYCASSILLYNYEHGESFIRLK